MKKFIETREDLSESAFRFFVGKVATRLNADVKIVDILNEFGSNYSKDFILDAIDIWIRARNKERA